MVAQTSLLAMGPLHTTSVAVRTGIEPGSRPWSARSVRIPLTHLSRSMRSMHQRGLAIESVRFDYAEGNAPVADETPVKPDVKESAKATKASQTAEKPPKKASRRRKR